eukprot:s2195_g3.t1
MMTRRRRKSPTEKDAEVSESEEKEEDEEVKPSKEEKKRSAKEEKKRSTKEEKKRSKDEEPPLREVMEDYGSDPAKIDLWSVFTHGGEPRQKDFASQVMEREYVRCREMLMRPLKSVPQGYGKRIQDLKIQVNEHIAECIDSLSVMEEDLGNASSEVRKKKTEIKALEAKHKEELEMKRAELKLLVKEEEAAEKHRDDVVKSKEAAGFFNEILDTCECVMKEVVSEMDEFAYLFQEQDSEAETRRKTLSAKFKRVKERKEGMSGSEAAPTPAPKPKAMPRDIKLKHEEEKKRKEKEEKEKNQMKRR